MTKHQDADMVLAKSIKQNSNNLTYDMIAEVFKQTGKWPRIDKVQKRVFVRNLTNGFLLLSSDEVENAKSAKKKFTSLSVAKKMYMVSYDTKRNLVDVWGPSQDAVRSIMLDVLRIVREGKTGRL